MKVLLWTRPTDGIGGDLIQAKKTHLALLDQGIDAELSDAYYHDAVYLQQFDLIHLFVFHCRINPQRFKLIKQSGRPVICSLLYRDPNYNE